MTAVHSTVLASYRKRLLHSAVLTGNRRIALRLLRLAEEMTLNPAVLRKLKEKKDSGRPLTSKEERLLARLDQMNVMAPAAQELSNKAPTGDFELDIDFDNPIEVGKKKKRDKLLGDLDPDARKMMERFMEETPSIDEQMRSDKEEIEESDPYGSSKPTLKVIGAARKLLVKVKLIRRRAEENLKQLQSSQAPAERAAAKELTEIVPSALAPLEQAEELLRRIEPIVKILASGNSQKAMRQLDQAVEEGLMGFRTWGSGINETLGRLRKQNEEAATKMGQVLSTRIKEAVRMLREDGKTPEEAGQAAWQLPAIQKLRFITEGAKAKVQAYDLVIHEMVAQYESSKPIIAQLKQLVSSLMEPDNAQKTAIHKSQTQKRLRRVAKRIVLLSYLRSKS